LLVGSSLPLMVCGKAVFGQRRAISLIGLEANRKGLKMAIESSFEQKIIPRRLSVDELFDDTTAGLG
jgi:hypothetical protein